MHVRVVVRVRVRVRVRVPLEESVKVEEVARNRRRRHVLMLPPGAYDTCIRVYGYTVDRYGHMVPYDVSIRQKTQGLRNRGLRLGFLCFDLDRFALSVSAV